LPRDYDRFDNKLLEDLLRNFDSDALRKASGDVFGRIYEYFLMKFAMHGLESDIREANSFYDDPHRLQYGRPLWGHCDFVMANPPYTPDDKRAAAELVFRHVWQKSASGAFAGRQ
jgi:type I restriction-modification system DNA methylase subunit